MGRIEARFADLKKKAETALVTFVTAGDPSLAKTEEILQALVEAGVDIIELGVPFSDPMADGPTIQKSSLRALEAGATLAGVLDLVSRVRRHSNVPIVLMGYYNPVFRFGVETFARKAAAAGVDGLLLVDLPPEESAEVRDFLRPQGIDLITLLAPTTPPQRTRELASRGEGFLYYVSMTGVTGSQAVDPSAIAQRVTELKRQSPVPVGVGFGISSAAEAAQVADFADAVVVGSALVRIIETCGDSPELVPRVLEFASSLKEAVRKH